MITLGRAAYQSNFRNNEFIGKSTDILKLKRRMRNGKY